MGTNTQTLLLVDDEVEVTTILAKRLARRGYSCVCAANGKEAIEAMQQESAGIIVMDVKMPVMDGLVALGIIHSRWPDSQIILLSGHADMQIAIQAMDQGAFGYLMKPVDFEYLLFKIEDAATQIRLESGV